MFSLKILLEFLIVLIYTKSFIFIIIIRLKVSKKLAEEADLKEIETNINLIKPKPGKVYYDFYSGCMKTIKYLFIISTCN